MTIAVAGSVALDLILRGEGPASAVNATGAVGNTGANIAIRLANAGHDVLFLTRIGADRTGRIVRQRLIEAGVRPDGLVFSPRYRTPLVFQSRSEDGAPSFTNVCPRCGTPGMDPQTPDASELDEPAVALLRSSTLFVSDIPSPSLATQARAASRWFEAGAPYIDRADARAACAAADVVKWSADEPEGAADAASARTDAWLVRTLGADGITLGRAGEEELRLPAAPVETLVDSMGAGDAFTAAAVNELDGRDSLDLDLLIRAAQSGIDAAARACTAFGARGDMGDAPTDDVPVGCAVCIDDA